MYKNGVFTLASLLPRDFIMFVLILYWVPSKHSYKQCDVYKSAAAMAMI